MRVYQAALSPLLGGACRFHPSCSHYAIEAIERHGAARGAWMALKRVLRCRPFAAGGFDPVPELPVRVGDSPADGDLKVAAAAGAAVASTARSLKAAPLERAQ